MMILDKTKAYLSEESFADIVALVLLGKVPSDHTKHYAILKKGEIQNIEKCNRCRARESSGQHGVWCEQCWEVVMKDHGIR